MHAPEVAFAVFPRRIRESNSGKDRRGEDLVDLARANLWQ
jgi:hypothetical protein